MRLSEIKFWQKFGLTAKILSIFLLLSLVSLGAIGLIAFNQIRAVGEYALESSSSLGDKAVNDSAKALTDLGENLIQQKAKDVARQLEIYIKSHNDLTIRELQNDSVFRSIAVQPVGQTGYTVVLDVNNGTYYFHKSNVFENKKAEDLFADPVSEYYSSQVWNLIDQMLLTHKDSGGYYDWKEPDGPVRPKYTWFSVVNTTTADGVQIFVAATTYIDEFSKPAKDTTDKINSAILASTDYIKAKENNMRNTFIVIFFIVLLIVAGLVFWLSRTITRPILALTKGARAIGDGELDYRVGVKTGDEIEELAQSFNKMATDLKQHMEDLRRTTAEKERVQKELEIARGIQQSFLPEFPPEVRGAELAAFNLPAKEVGGDFYDFIPVSPDKWGLVIADVSGKGVPAALFMALSRTLVRANATGNLTASEAIRRANDLIAQEERTGMFVTLFYGVLDTKAMTLTYVNAGHNLPLMFRDGGTDIIMLAAKGIALGVMQDIELEEKTISLRSGDTMVLYTDGVTEAINNQEEQFGQERLISIVQGCCNLNAEELLRRIADEVTAFSQEQSQFDDITLMVLKVL